MNKQILVTRMKDESDQLMEQIEAIGAVPLHCPCIETRKVNISRADLPPKGEWLFFTSGKGVQFFMDQPGAAHCMESCFIAVVGPQTARAVEAYGYRVHFMPDTYEATVMMEQFVFAFPDVQRIWHVQSTIALTKIHNFCVEKKLIYMPLVVYDTVRLPLTDVHLDRLMRADWLMATSPSIIAVLIGAAGAGTVDLPLLLEKRLFCIGPTTERAAREAGFKETYFPSEYTVSGLLDLLREHIEEERGRENGELSNSPE